MAPHRVPRKVQRAGMVRSLRVCGRVPSPQHGTQRHLPVKDSSQGVPDDRARALLDGIPQDRSSDPHRQKVASLPVAMRTQERREESIRKSLKNRHQHAAPHPNEMSSICLWIWGQEEENQFHRHGSSRWIMTPGEVRRAASKWAQAQSEQRDR
jgi:hypothetical protein